MFQDKPIGNRLNLGFALLAGMLLVAGVAGIIGTEVVQQGLSRMFSVSLPAIDSLIEADRDLQQLLVSERTMIFVDVKSEQFKALVDDYEKNLKQSQERFEAFKALADTPEEKELIDKYEAARADWLAVSSKIVEGRKSDTRDGRRLALDLSLTEAAQKFEGMRDYIDKLTQIRLERAAKDESRAKTVFWITVAVICAVTLASLVIGKIFCRKVTLSITRPLAEIVEASDALARGDFTHKIAYKAKDEVGKLADSLRSMLSGVIGEGQSIKKGIPLPMFVTDPSGVATFANAKLQELVLALTGRPANDMLGKAKIGELLPDKKGKLTADVAACVSKGNSCDEEHEFALKSGPAVIRFTVAPLLDLEGNRIGTMGIGSDLTEQKRQNLMIREQQDQIVGVAEQASGISEALSMASAELFSQVEQVAKGARSQSERAAETATAMEEMNATVLEVARNAGQAAESAESAKGKAVSGQDIVNKMVDAIHEADALTGAMRENLTKLGAQAQDIGQIMNVITDIADQTNLLALNAAIEAARAGEAGRGFAVVADEVRKLAEKTMQATKQVGDAVRSIQEGAKASMSDMERASGAVSQSAGLAGEAGGALGEIVMIVEATTDQVRSIATAAEEQSAASEEINRAVDDINRISGETAEGMSQADSAVGELAKQAEDLKRLILELGADKGNKALPA